METESIGGTFTFEFFLGGEMNKTAIVLRKYQNIVSYTNYSTE